MGNPILRGHGTVAHQARVTWNFHKTLDMVGFINAAALMNPTMSSVLWKFHVTRAWWATVP